MKQAVSKEGENDSALQKYLSSVPCEIGIQIKKLH